MERFLVVSELLPELEAKPGKAKTSRLNCHRLPRGCQRYGVAVQEISPSFVMFSGTTGPLKSKVDHAARAACQGKGGHAVDLIEKYAGRRVISDAITTVHQGGTVEMATLRLDPQGVHKGGLFRKTIAAGVRRHQTRFSAVCQWGRVQMDWSEVIQERLAAESPVGGDVSEEALRRGWVFPFAEGQYVYGAEWTGLVRRLQELLLTGAADHGFREYMFPRLIPAEAARNFQLSQFNPFLLWNVGDNAKVLDPVQCLAFYQVLRGRRFRADDLPLKIVETLGGWTWRRERPERLDGMFRAVEYARVEHVWLATPSQSQDIRNKMCDSLVDLLTELGLSVRTVVGKPCLPLQSFEDRTEAATSADHVPGIDIELLVRPPQSPDSITPGPYAVTPEGFDEVGGCTIEGDHHLSSFDIGRDDGGPLSSGCCGIGLNRVVIAFLFQHGFVRSNWPDLIARGMDARPPTPLPGWPASALSSPPDQTRPAPHVRAVERTGPMTQLPTREQMFDNAVELLDQAYKLLGDAADCLLRSDWTPVGSSLTDAQADRRTRMFGQIAKAKNAINQAKG